VKGKFAYLLMGSRDEDTGGLVFTYEVNPAIKYRDADNRHDSTNYIVSMAVKSFASGITSVHVYPGREEGGIASYIELCRPLIGKRFPSEGLRELGYLIMDEPVDVHGHVLGGRGVASANR
jgi:hypothetical protein